MIDITVKDIIEATGGKLLSGSAGEAAGGFSIESRTVQSGEFFIAINGRNYDSHDFIPEAVERGARGIIIDRESAYGPETSDVNFILVSNEEPEKVKAFAVKHGYQDLPLFINRNTPSEFASKSIPATFVINKKGDVVVNKKGAARWNSGTMQEIFNQMLRD